jgi:cytochrome c peroxidase
MPSHPFAATHLLVTATALAVCLCVYVAARAAGDDIDPGPPPALAPGQAPPLPKAGPLAAPRAQDQIGFPAELTKSVIPPGSSLTPAVVALGEKLFFDPRLSGDGTVACATCHDPARAFTDGRPVSIGIAGRAGQRNAPTILNALYNKTQFWDGRVNTLEEQAALPITNPFEMGAASIGDAIAHIAGDADYKRQFSQAFGRDVNEKELLTAIATYERTLTSFGSPFDRFIAGDQNAMSDAAKRGWESFNSKARCNLCHALTDNRRDVTVFTDNDFHNIGIGILRHRVVPLAVQAERDLAQGRFWTSTRRRSRARLRCSAAFSSPARRPTSPPSRPLICATCWSPRHTSTTDRSKPCGMRSITTTRVMDWRTRGSMRTSSRWR